MEIDTVQKVELRLVLANSDEKFTAALATFLPALLQKLASPNVDVVAKVVDVLKFVKKRRRDSSQVRLPIQKLTDLYRASVLNTPLTRQNRQVLSFIGLELSLRDDLELPVDTFVYGLRLDRLHSAEEVRELAAEQFSLFLLLLNRANSHYDPATAVPLCDITSWEKQDLETVRIRLPELFLLDLRHRAVNNQFALTPAQVHFFTDHGAKIGVVYPQVNDSGMSSTRNSALNLARSHPDVFQNVLVAAMGDPVLDISRKARAEVLKMKHVDHEFVQNVAVRGNLSLRTNAMEILARHKLYDGVNTSLLKSALSQEDLHLRQAVLILVRDAIVSGGSQFSEADSSTFCNYLKQYIFDDGWPRSQFHSKIQTQLRQMCYELIGVFSSDKSTVSFLLQSLDRDSPEMASSIQKALSSVMRLETVDIDSEKLLEIMLHSRNNRTRYSVVCFASKLASSSPVARVIPLLGLDKATNSSDVIMEAQKGLLANTAEDLPSYDELFQQVGQSLNLHTASKDAIECTVLYLLVCLVRWPPASLDWVAELNVALESLSPLLDDRIRKCSSDQILLFVRWLFDMMTSSKTYSEVLPLITRKLLLSLSTEQRLTLASSMNMDALANSLLHDSTEYGSFIAEYSPLLLSKASFFVGDQSRLAVLFNAYLSAIHGIQSAEVKQLALESKNVEAIQVLAACNMIQSSDSLDTLASSQMAKACIAMNSSQEQRKAYLTELLNSQPKGFDEIVSNGEAISVAISGWSSKTIQKRYPYLVERYSNTTNNEWEIEEFALKKVTEGIRGSPDNRRIASVRLLCMTQNSFYDIAKFSGVVAGIQACFMNLLTDSDDITQEAAGRGLSILFENGGANKELQQNMLSTLLSSFTDDTTARKNTSGTLTADTQVFQPGLLPSDPKGKGGSISTYKDILNLANETGDSSLVYKFMSLSSSSQIWTGRKGIAFSLQQIVSKSEISSQILNGSEFGNKLIPKLFRYLYDPIEVTKTAMKHIWTTLIPPQQRSQVIKTYLPYITKELYDGITNREWRVRQASCLALSDMISNRNIQSNIEIWRIGFRAIDDIKESISTAGSDLLKSLSNSLIRSNSANENTDLNEIIPFLISGLSRESSVAFSLDVLLKLSETEGFKPFSALVLEELCLQLSSLEPQALNYLALNTSQSMVDDARATGLRSSPIMKGLESMVRRGSPSNEEMWSLLPKLVKRSVGVSSKLAAARLMTLTCMQTYGNENPGSEKLLRIATNEIWSSNDVICEGYASAVGYLCRQLSLPLVVSYITTLREKFLSTESDDIRTRGLVGQALKKLSTNANDVFSSVASAALPLAYVAMSTQDEDAAYFKSAWDENTGGSASLKLYGSDIINFSVEVLENSSSRSLKISAAKAITSVLSAASDTSMVNGKVVSLAATSLLKNLVGRSWPQKEHIFAALVSVYKALPRCELSEQIESRVLNEIERKNEEYKLGILASAAEFFKSLSTDGPNEEYIATIENKLYDNSIEVVNNNEEAQIEAYKAVLGALSTKELTLKLLEHAFQLKIWQFNLATCSVIKTLPFDTDIWQLVTKECTSPNQLDIVRREWAQAADHFQELNGMTD